MAEILDRLKAALAGRYTIEREVGAGGMATVYLAADVKHRRKVAVKVLRPELAATLGSERFLREIEIAAGLQHPHILPLLDSGEAGGPDDPAGGLGGAADGRGGAAPLLYYVMPFIEGESLRDRLAKQGELPISEAVKILAEVVDALAYAHSRGVVHRDIKPDNVMLSGRHALVTDFGVAKAVSEATGRQQMTTAGVALGTPAYMAPEQAAADPNVDHRADIYAVGAMGYELLTGQPPFTGLTPQMVLAAHVTQAPENVSTRRPAVPPALASVIMKCLAKRPADRWQSADQLLGQLEPLATPSGGSTPASTAPYMATTATGDRWYGHPIRVAGLFALASVAVLGAVYFLTIQLGLPNWVPWGALALLAAGLPIMIVTGLIERRRARAHASGAIPTSGESTLHGWFTWRKAIMGGVTAFAVLGIGTLVYTAMRLLGIGPVGTLVASGKLGARDKMIIADFENRASDSTLGPSVTEAFRIDLAQSQAVKVVSSSEVGDALQRMNRDPKKPFDATTAKELAVREGAKAVVVGEISPIGAGFVLSAKLVAATGGVELLALRETAEDSRGILKAIDRLSGRMRERIGESLRTIRATGPLDQVTTSSLEALRLYSDGARASDIGESERAISLLKQAIALDTGFAMAWRKLAVVLGNSFASQAEEFGAATKAFQYRDRLPEIERYLTTAYYHSTVDYDPEKEVASYQAVLAINPDELTALNNLALVYEQRRQWAQAEPMFRRAADLEATAIFYQGLVRTQMAQGKVTEARASLAQFAAAVPESPVVRGLRGRMLASLGQYDSSAAELQALRQEHRELNYQGGASFSLATVAQIRGKLDDAERYYRDAMTANEKRGVLGGYLGAASALAGSQALYRRDPTLAMRSLEAVLARHPLNSLPALDRPYSALAVSYARAQQPERAKRLLAEYEVTVPEGIRRGDEVRHQAAGYVALAEGRTQDAISEFRAWYDETGCPRCAQFEIGAAYEQAKQPDSALAAYERGVTSPAGPNSVYDQAWTLAQSYQRLGELYEERGNKDRALDYYGRFVQLWKDADPVLQPQVKEIRERMTKLAGEK